MWFCVINYFYMACYISLLSTDDRFHRNYVIVCSVCIIYWNCLSIVSLFRYLIDSIDLTPVVGIFRRTPSITRHYCSQTVQIFGQKIKHAFDFIFHLFIYSYKKLYFNKVWSEFPPRQIYNLKRFALGSYFDESEADFFFLPSDFDLTVVMLSCNCVKKFFDDFSALLSSSAVFLPCEKIKKNRKSIK